MWSYGLNNQLFKCLWTFSSPLNLNHQYQFLLWGTDIIRNNELNNQIFTYLWAFYYRLAQEQQYQFVSVTGIFRIKEHKAALQELEVSKKLEGG